MPMGPEGWYMDAGPPLWNARGKTLSFYLHKPGCESVLCVLAIEALEHAVQSDALSEPALNRIFDAHRLMLELRAAQKLNAGLLDSAGCVRLVAEDLSRR
jgi:hypothetical protein